MGLDFGSLTGIPYEDYKNHSLNLTIVLVIAGVVLAYYAFFALLSPTQTSQGSSQSLMWIIVGGVFISLIVLNGAVYFYNIDVTASIRDFFTDSPLIDVAVSQGGLDGIAGPSSEAPVPEIPWTQEVFHVKGNKYTYEDAKAICKGYQGRLATIEEIENSYNNGADWCEYGWSAEQMALYPTQYSKWKTLQKIKGHKHDCGRPGINGGYIANPNIKFGVNCYGHKPEITQSEANAMQKELEQPVAPPSPRQEKWDKKLPYLTISPFNKEQWSELS